MKQKVTSAHLGTLLAATLIGHGYKVVETRSGTIFEKGDSRITDLNSGWTPHSGTEGDDSANTAFSKDLDGGMLAIADDATPDSVTIMSVSNYNVAAAQRLRLAGYTVVAPNKSGANRTGRSG